MNRNRPPRTGRPKIMFRFRRVSATIAGLFVFVATAIGLIADPHAIQASPAAGVNVYMYRHKFCTFRHGGAILHMCTVASSGCKIDGNVTEVRARSHLAHEGDTFAPPIVASGGMRVSQGLAATVFAGERLGFNVGVTNAAKAFQYMLDLQDFVHELEAVGYKPEAMEAKYPRPGRQAAWLAHFERSISGPFYFGQAPSYVDFFLLAQLKWVEDMQHAEYPSRTLLAKFPKVAAILHSELGREATRTYLIQPMDYGPEDYQTSP